MRKAMQIYRPQFALPVRAPQQPPAPLLSASILPTVDPLLSLPGPQAGMPSLAPRQPALRHTVSSVQVDTPVDTEDVDGGEDEGSTNKKRRREKGNNACMQVRRKDPVFRQREAEAVRCGEA